MQSVFCAKRDGEHIVQNGALLNAVANTLRLGPFPCYFFIHMKGAQNQAGFMISYIVRPHKLAYGITGISGN